VRKNGRRTETVHVVIISIIIYIITLLLIYIILLHARSPFAEGQFKKLVSVWDRREMITITFLHSLL
jgi:hypothetical protein